jgi:hypothetical protein
MSRLIRAALSLLVGAAMFVTLPVAHADHATCDGTTHEMGKAAAGVVGGAAGQYDSWTSMSYYTARTFTVKSVGDGYGAAVEIYAAGCAGGSPICSGSQVAPDTSTCTIYGSGEVIVVVSYPDPNDGHQASYVVSTDAPPATCVEGVPNVVACIGATSDLQHVAVTTSTPEDPSSVFGTLEIYRVTLASVVLTVPCVVVQAAAQTVNPCAAAGGEYVSTLATLVDTSASGLGPDVVTIGICNGRMTLTVAAIGVESAPVVVPC